jgi:hypothetical protein
MTHTRWSWLSQVESPWITIGYGEPEGSKIIPSYFYSRPEWGNCVRVLRGWKMRTRSGMMSEFGAALQFFDEFGENYYALEECLEYLDEWLPADGYVLVVHRAEELLVEEPQTELCWLMRTLHEAAEAWARPIEDGDHFDRPARPFHALLLLGVHDDHALHRLAAAAASGGVPVRSV